MSNTISNIAEAQTSAVSGVRLEPEMFPTLRSFRERAANTHRTLGIPTTKEEEWRFTSLRKLEESTFTPGASEVLVQDDALLAGKELDRHLVTFVNGKFMPNLSGKCQEQGLEVKCLSQAISQGDTAVLEHLGQIASIDDHTFGALNTASFTDGAFIHLLAGAQITKPIHVLHITSGKGSYAAPRLLVICEKGSNGFLVESYSGAKSGFVSAVTEMFIDSNAHLEHVKLQAEEKDSIHIALSQARQARDSSFNSFNVTLGGGLTRNDLNVFLDGSNLHCRMDGIAVLDGEQHCDNHTRLDHAMPHCDSFEVYKHILDDRASAVFNGKIFVHQDAQKTDAKQTNQTLLLSPTAVINSKPQLEIFADDVKCTHGATVGQLDEESLFYLRSRGIPLSESRALLVYAFAAEVLEKISNASVRAILEKLLYDKLSQVENRRCR